ncbi:MAG: DUF2218 domain-containing protein [bacterium]|nr:DUF2218 domain-containing protein [bacterium]
MTTQFTSVAEVSTERPARFAKQLVSHLSRRTPALEIDGGHRLTFRGEDGETKGTCDVVAGADDQLSLRAEAPEEAGLTLVENVVGRHLERFGEREGLTVSWQR